GLILLTYVVTAFLVHADWGTIVFSTFIPHVELTKAFMLTLIAVFGVTISPYEFFWQANEEVEELVDEHAIPREGVRPQSAPAEVRAVRGDTAFGMFFSNLVTFFIIIVAAATLHVHGHTDVQNAADAARMLRPLAGPFAAMLFGIGIVGSGLLAIPVMAGSSAYAVGGSLGWPRSLAKPFWQEWRFYGVIVASCVIGIAVNFAHIPPFTLLFYAGVLNGIISPPLLFVVTRIAGNRKLMGRYANNRFSSAIGWTLCAFMSLALVLTFVLSR
ncbi:MAG TPA: divalent metal cation transporter, partial [Candidatus Aquilonibacter sp.]